MTATQRCSFLPQDPYYIPGYSGFYPQVRYQVGKTYGRTTNDILTDPEVYKSPNSVLTPISRPKFIEDFSRRPRPTPEPMDQHQNYIPGYTGGHPPCSHSIGPEPPRWTDPDSAQLLEQRKYSPCHPGIRLACGPGWRQFTATAGSRLVSGQGDRKAICHPDVALVCGKEAAGGPCDAGMSLPTRIEGTPLPQVTETVDVRRFDRMPKMDVPNLIQRNAISGYTGFIPRFTWIMGINYLKGVKDAMNEFDKNQEILRSPMYCFGQRLPHTYWPNTKIYSSNGLLPFYTGFVPSKHNYALTFGNSTRKAYYDELLRRQPAG
uniref:Ciliary microtubule inner protein 2A-C-like domain-containing protein n=1 Tax=Anolis carolinensis TaxID=28377 RepID=H9GJB5_ANOCA